MNIFARELAQVLANHGRELSSLYTIKSPTLLIHPGKVTRLKRSLTEDRTATLNADELEMLREQVPLSEAEMQRLHAAFVAETVRYVLAGRMPLAVANQIAALTFELLVARDAHQMEVMRNQILEQIRWSEPPAEAGRAGQAGAGGEAEGGEGPAEEAAGPIERALDAATREYERGTLWLEMARDTADRGARLGYLAQAKALLARARTLAASPGSAALGTPQQAELLELIDAARADADVLG